MGSIMKHIQILYDQELYTNVIRLCDLTLSGSDQRPETFSLSNKLQITYYYAEALYKTEQYIQAENWYRQCLQLRKNVIKARTTNNKIGDKISDTPCDIDIKYKLHLCCLALQKNSTALEILQSIGPRHKNARVNMALGNLLRDAGMDRSAAVSYKEVLEECPLALEAVENLLKLGIRGVEVNSLIMEATSEINWLNTWFKAQAQLYSRDFAKAISTYKAMDTHGLLKDNVYLLVNMGYCYHYMCDEKKAIAALQRAYRLDPNLTFGLDLLSTLLANSEVVEHTEYLETIIPSKKDMSLWTSEQWVVLGNYMYAIKNYERAAYFGQQAYFCTKKNNIEALLLKANTFVQLNKYQDAANHCTEALQMCSFRYDIHKCLVECYIKMNRLREADAMAINACKQLNYSAHALKLHATVLLKDPINNSKMIKKILEKAITQDKDSSTNAVVMLVVFLEQEQQYEHAKQLLLKHIEVFPSSRMHQLLGECYFNLQKDEDAFHHYNVALKLDPSNQRAMEGLNLIGPNPSSKRDSYYTCVGESSYTSQGTNVSDHEADAESDTDLWASNADMVNFE